MQENPSHSALDYLDAVTYLKSPEKFPYDTNNYKVIVLSNGLRVLLISEMSAEPQDDETTSSSTYVSSADSCSAKSEQSFEKTAACALLVDVGSFADPSKYQGLAHLLEHMIFMGSEKYPTENAFDAHIQKCGGFNNANTDCEETVFYFEVSEEHLDSSMDYFTSMLKAPLLKKEAMTRELNAVESEFQEILQDDEVRRCQLLASLATSCYPHGSFLWGNLKSLKDHITDNDLHKALHKFHKRHYSGHRMIACMQACLPMDELVSLAVKHLSGIPSNKLSGCEFEQFDYRTAFCEDFYKRVYFVKPVANVCKLELTWVLPPMTKLYKCKPDTFLSYLINCEGEGSLCAYLRKKLWVLDVIAGIYDDGFVTNSMYSLFNIYIHLTDSGFKHLDEVLAATFAFIKLLSHCGSLKDAFTELQNLHINTSEYDPLQPASDNVQELVKNTKYYPSEDILTACELYVEYIADEIENVIEHLNEFKFNIMITSQQKYDSIRYDQKEKWFGTEFTSIEMPNKWVDLWTNSEPMQDLHLPKQNRFIQNDSHLFWEESGKPRLKQAPKKILQTDICELWFRQDDKYHLPEANMNFYFISPQLRKTTKNYVMCSLYADLVKFRLVEELYPATVVGLSYDFFLCDKGVTLTVYGNNDKLHLIVANIVTAMVTMREHICAEQLEVFKTHQKKSYFNDLIKPRSLNEDIRLSILNKIHWTTIDKYKCVNDITLKDMLDFAENYTKELYVQALMQGNLYEELALTIMNSVLSTFNCQNIKETMYIESRTVQLPEGSRYIRCRALNDKDVNTVVTNFYQIGPCASVCICIILDMLIELVEEPLFENLRSKEQLGYYVSSSVCLKTGIVGYSITINSQENKFDAAHVEERIEVFRSKMVQILEAMPDDDFQKVRKSLIMSKQVVDMSLDEEVSRNWKEIICDEYMFDRRRREIHVLRTLTKNDIIDLALNNDRMTFRKLSVQVIGNKTVSPLSDNNNLESHEENCNSSDELESKLSLEFIPKDGDETTIVDINDFKKDLFVYTKPKMDTSTIDHTPAMKSDKYCRLA